jgi:hypothetical protein
MYCYPECKDPWFNECADCWKSGGNPAIGVKGEDELPEHPPVGQDDQESVPS